MPRFISAGYVWQILVKEAYLGPPIPEQPRKSPSWIGLINLSGKNLSASQISLLFKDLKFLPTINVIDRAEKKTELAEVERNYV